MELKEYDGDLLDAEVDAIAHQCNCSSRGVAGLARVMFTRHPEADRNAVGVDARYYGYSTVHKVEGFSYKYVVNLFAQLFVGGPTWGLDSEQERLKAFRSSIVVALSNPDAPITSIAFPYNIGCALAGGDWNRYRQCLLELAGEFPNTEFHIIRKEEVKTDWAAHRKTFEVKEGGIQTHNPLGNV